MKTIPNHKLKAVTLPDIKKNVLATLAYFDMFNYPLTQSEIYLFLANRYDSHLFINAVQCLVANQTIFRYGDFYSLRNNSNIAERRQKGNKKAEELIAIAGGVGKFLIKFPYVRGIGISGSLSKNFADENSDIDLFIITAANRLWIARTLMHLFKKITFLVKKEHFFCMNYFIDEEQLEIVEKNLYTATEVATLMPLEGDAAFAQFYSANTWTRDYLPNNFMRISTAKPLEANLFKRIAESVFNNRFGMFLDTQLMRITAGRWQKKSLQKKLNSRGVVMGMDANKHCAKPDPRNFQNKLMGRYQTKVELLLTEYENNLVHN